jgi:hypothetical protein
VQKRCFAKSGKAPNQKIFLRVGAHWLFFTFAASENLFFTKPSFTVMFKRFLTLAVLALLLAGTNSCSKSDVADVQELDDSVLNRIEALGFHSEGACATDGGYIVEGDIFLTDEDLNKVFDVASLIVGNEEQYRTTNLVTGLPRNIKIRVANGLASSITTATDAAIARYNAEGLQLTFTRVTSGGNIVIKKAPNGAGYIAAAGFPTSNGNPYSQILFNNNYSSWNANTLASVIAHEIGHCIGFRHTDYMNRQYSCGGSFYNEGQAGVGAIHIPGTPTGPDANSWMLACIGNGTNRPFNANDKTALNYLY